MILSSGLVFDWVAKITNESYVMRNLLCWKCMWIYVSGVEVGLLMRGPLILRRRLMVGRMIMQILSCRLTTLLHTRSMLNWQRTRLRKRFRITSR